MARKLLVLLIGVFFVFISLAPVSMAATGGPDAGGYEYYDSNEEDVAPFEWESIFYSKYSKAISDFTVDGGSAVLVGPIEIGFTFTFYGVDYTQVYISKYGYLTFNDGPPLGSPYIEPIPTDSRYKTENFIAGMWGYLHPGA